MSLPKQKFREIVFLWLFCSDFAPDEEGMIDLIMFQLRVTKKAVKEALENYKRILSLIEEIDGKIARASLSYEIDRIGRTEKAVLRLAIYELFYEKEVPPKVAIAEGIRLTRKFAVGESASFVNAVLDSLLTEVSRLEEGNSECSRAVFVE